MKDLINLYHKNHSLIYKLFLFIITTFVIVYLFPKSGTFRYSFEKGKPWQSENLYAPFDFAIKKSTEEIISEKEQIAKQSAVFFDIDTEVYANAKSDYELEFNSLFYELPNDFIKAELYENGLSILDQIYKSGVLEMSYDYGPNQQISILKDKTQNGFKSYLTFFLQTNLKSFVESQVINLGIQSYRQRFLALFFDIIKPNASLNKVLTNAFLEERLSQLKLVRGRVEKQTLIISKGEVVQGENYSILKSLESEYESQELTDSNYYWILSAYTLLVSLALLMLLLFVKKYRAEVFDNNTKVTFIFFNIILMVLLTTLVVNLNSSYVYVVPLCILPLTLKAFFDARLGLFVHVITVLLLGFVVANNYEYMFLQTIAGIVTILTVSELYKRANLFIAVAQITAIYILAYFSFFVIHEGGIEFIKLENFALFILCGLGTLFVHPLIYIYEKVFGLVSDVSLLELSDTNSELLKLLSDKSQGTFNHSLSVANLAEAAANEVGANSLLARVGALYHDIGKMNNPSYFSENQLTGVNPHDELNSKESVRIILDHVIQGIEIARKYNIPERVIDFIRTHHGTSLVYYFYNKDLKLEIKPDEKDYMYGGPKPFSKETAIVMMCDGVEAASKSLKNPDFVKINEFVNLIISKQINSDQFINANITFKEIEVIKKVLINKLINIFHIRIEYPQ